MGFIEMFDLKAYFNFFSIKFWRLINYKLKLILESFSLAFFKIINTNFFSFFPFRSFDKGFADFFSESFKPFEKSFWKIDSSAATTLHIYWKIFFFYFMFVAIIFILYGQLFLGPEVFQLNNKERIFWPFFFHLLLLFLFLRLKFFGF